jgi:pilus assembly protein CpaB
MLRLFKNKIFVGSMCLLVAGALAFILLPRLYKAQASIVEVVKLKQTVEYGTVITDNMLTVEEVGSYGLSENIVTNKSEIIGLTASSTIYAGEFLWRERFITAEAYEETITKASLNLPKGTYLLTINVPSASAGVAGILRAGDIVDVYGYTEDNGTAIANKALSAVKVYAVLNSKLISLDDLDAELNATPDAKPSDFDFAPAFIVFIVNEQQATTLIGLEKAKALHLTLLEAGA